MLLPIRWPIHTIATANKIEKLTYSAQTRVVDPCSRLEQLKKEQDEELKRVRCAMTCCGPPTMRGRRRNLDSVSHPAAAVHVHAFTRSKRL